MEELSLSGKDSTLLLNTLTSLKVDGLIIFADKSMRFFSCFYLQTPQLQGSAQ